MTAASIWHSDFSSLYEKYLYYLTGPGSFILKPYNPFLLLTAVFVIAFILFINPSNLSPIVKSLHPIKFDIFSSVFLLSLTTSLPYFLLATDTNHKTVFLGSFIGISISLWFTFIVVYLFSIILKNISVPKSPLDYSYFKYYKPSLIAVISLLIYASASSYTFEYIYWGQGYSRDSEPDKVIHRSVVNSITNDVMQVCDQKFRSSDQCNAYLAITSYINVDLLRSYASLNFPPSKRFEFKAPGEILDFEQQKSFIDESDVVVFSSDKIPGANRRFGFYIPQVQEYLNSLRSKHAKVNSVVVERDSKPPVPIYIVNKLS